MTTYKPGEEWKKTLNENTFLKMRVTELQEENETLRIEIIEMRNAADQTDEVLDEYFEDEEKEQSVELCNICSEELYWSHQNLRLEHISGYRLCGVGHDPKGNEY